VDAGPYPGTVSIPYHELKRLDEVPRDGTWIIAYCGCPHHLSGIVVDELRRRGYAHAVVLDEGINEWHRRSLPVTADRPDSRQLLHIRIPPLGLGSASASSIAYRRPASRRDRHGRRARASRACQRRNSDRSIASRLTHL
jgi:hypothetical protein